MKVLFASDYNCPNSIIKSYIDGISPLCELTSGVAEFWESNLIFDILHIQWPEELMVWDLYNEIDLKKLEDRFIYWKSINTKIIITRHNASSHRKFYLDDKLYDLCFNYADGIVHLGEYSLTEFKNHNFYSTKCNTLINHPNYLNIPNLVSHEIARKHLRVSSEAIVYLSFGAIRDKKEESNLIAAFKKTRIKGKQLIITNSLLFKKKKSFRRYPFKRLSYEFQKFYLKIHNIIIVENTNISESDIQYYFNLANFIIVPRLNQLNSGVVYLAFTFSKIVVGPDIANIGALLNKTGNITYDPNDIGKFVSALERAFKYVSKNSLELSNYNYAINDCNATKIGMEHINLYKKIKFN